MNELQLKSLKHVSNKIDKCKVVLLTNEFKIVIDTLDIDEKIKTQLKHKICTLLDDASREINEARSWLFTIIEDIKNKGI